MKQKIETLRLEGLTYREIANQLGCALSTVCYHLNPVSREKILKRNRKHTNNYRRKLREWLRSIKVEIGCESCGEGHPATLQFHHKDRSKKEYTIASAVNNHKYSKKKLMLEIAKCTVLCANCHFKLHWEDHA